MPLMAPFGAGVPSDFGLARRPNTDSKVYLPWVTQAQNAGADVILTLDQSGSGAGAFVDSSGNGHHLTPNTTIVNGSNMLGANQALADSVFDFSTGLAQATSAYDVTQAQMSMGVRVKPLSLTASGSQLYNIVMSCATAGNTRGWDIGYRTNGTWTLIFAGVAVYEFGGAPLATVGVSTSFMVVLRSGNRADLYLDGVFKLRVTTGSMLLGSGTTLTINSYPTNGGNYQGKFEAEAAEIYRYPLTDDQVFQSHNAGIQPLPDTGSPAVFPIQCDATQAQSAAQIRSAGRVVETTQVQAAVHIRITNRASSATQPQSAAQTRSIEHTSGTTQAQAASSRRAVNRSSTTTQAQAVVCVKSKAALIVIAATQGQVAAQVRGVNHASSATQPQAAAQTRSVAHTSSTSQPQSAAQARRAGRTASATQQQAAAQTRVTNRVSPTTQAQVVMCVKSKATLIAIATTQAQSVGVLRSVVRVSAATQAQAAASSWITARRITATQPQIVLNIRRVPRRAAATQAQIATVALTHSSPDAVAVTRPFAQSTPGGEFSLELRSPGVFESPTPADAAFGVSKLSGAFDTPIPVGA